jgi:hypothetical protein
MHMLAYIFLAFAIGLRFAVALEVLPYPFNFAAIGAALLFFGAFVERRRQWGIALAAAVTADLVLTRFVYALPFQWDILATFAWYAAILWLGSLLRHNAGALRVGGAALTASVSFFLVSNFAVWAFTGLYPKTLAGLMTSYTLAIPFFRSTLAGDLFFTAAFFATAALMQGFARAQQRGHLPA